MHMIAKFRVLSLHENHHGHHEADLRPVLPKTPTTDWCTEARSEENVTFWSATPSGEAKVCGSDFLALRAQYPVGGAVYIDLIEDPAGPWRLTSMTVHPGSDQVDVTFYPDAGRGCVCMRVDQPLTAAKLRTAGPRWRVEFRQAEG